MRANPQDADPRAYAVKIRRFILAFLLTLPFAVLRRVENARLVPLITRLAPYPRLSLGRIGVQLQNPFSKMNLSHLPIDDVAAAVERT